MKIGRACGHAGAAGRLGRAVRAGPEDYLDEVQRGLRAHAERLGALLEDWAARRYTPKARAALRGEQPRP